jgi:hypothetical protein
MLLVEPHWSSLEAAGGVGRFLVSLTSSNRRRAQHGALRPT